MLVFGSQMELITFLFVCLEILILFSLITHKLVRPEDRTTRLDITLIVLLLIYNITGGLLPDSNLPGSYYLQEAIAYGTGFITPCYFPYYVYKGFSLDKMKFHAYRGVLFFLIIPYILFLFVFAISGTLEDAKYILVIPAVYGFWVVCSVYRSIQYKYQKNFSSKKAKEELVVLFLGITPWIGLPFIAYFDLSQAVEAPTTNTGFLVLMAFHIKRTIEQLKLEHKRLMEAELTGFNELVSRPFELKAENPAEYEFGGPAPLIQDEKSQFMLVKSNLRIQSDQKFEKNSDAYSLTRREKDIARLIRQGYMYKTIADTLNISERTVTTHVRNIFKKVDVGSKIELINKLAE